MYASRAPSTSPNASASRRASATLACASPGCVSRISRYRCLAPSRSPLSSKSLASACFALTFRGSHAMARARYPRAVSASPARLTACAHEDKTTACARRSEDADDSADDASTEENAETDESVASSFARVSSSATTAARSASSSTRSARSKSPSAAFASPAPNSITAHLRRDSARARGRPSACKSAARYNPRARSVSPCMSSNRAHCSHRPVSLGVLLVRW